MRRIALALLIVVLAACGDDDDSASTDSTTDTTESTESTEATEAAPATEQVTVDIQDFAFSPREIEVAVGQELVWTNGDDFAHTAEGDDGTFDTGNLDAGATSEPVTFDEPGTYSYFCGIHNSMTGTVTVTA